MHRDTPHQKHKQQRAQQMPPKRHMQPPAARQRPSLDQELYAASRKARTTNTPRIYAAPRTAPTPHAVTVAAKMAVAGTAKTKAATAPTGRHMHMPPSQSNPRTNLGCQFYAASRKSSATNTPRIYATPRIVPTPHAATARAGTATPAIPQGPKLGRTFYAADCRAKAALLARRSNPQRPNLRRHPYAASRKVDAIAPLYAAPCNRVPASRTHQG